MGIPATVVLIPERNAVSIEATEFVLTPTEFALFAILAGQVGRAFHRRELVEQAIGTVVEDRTVDTHVKSIRRKFGPYGHGIQTVRGIGYRWEPPEVPE